MKYFITEYKNQEARDTLHSLGLFCYSLRSADDNWGKIETIENYVLINRYGTIITTENLKLGDKYPDDFIDFDEFALENTKVSSINELKEEISDYGVVDLSNDENIENEFASLFEHCDNYEELNKMPTKDKFNYFIEHYDNVNDYVLVANGNHIYQLLHIDLEKNKNKEMDLIQ